MSEEPPSHDAIRIGSAKVATVRIWLEPATGPEGGVLRIQVKPVRGIALERDKYFDRLEDFQAWFAEQVALLGPPGEN